MLFGSFLAHLEDGRHVAIALPLRDPEQHLRLTRREAEGFLQEIGTLEVGKAADLAIWDIKSPAELSYWLGTPLLRERVFAGRVV